MNRTLISLSLLLVLAGIVARLSHLDADPDYYSWIGAYIDEGRWTAVARGIALEGKLLLNPRNHNFFVAPSFEAVSAVSFLAAGEVSLWSARLFPALCGCGILITLFVCFRRYATPLGLFAGLCVVALQEDLVSLSRVAIPETPAMLGALWAWLALDAGRENRLWLFGAGLALVATLSLKMTSFVLIPGFVLIAWTQRSGAQAPDRLRDAGAFVSGLALPGLVGLVGALVLLPDPGAIFARLERLTQFLEIRSLFSMIDRFFSMNVSPGMNVALLGFWLATLLLWVPSSVADAADSSEPQGVRRRLRSAWLWALTWLLAMTLQVYFPERYQVHLYIPLALTVGFAVTRFESIGWTGLAQGMRVARPHERLAFAFVVALPWAIWIASSLVAVLGGIGLDVERLSVRLVAIAVAFAPTLFAVFRLGPHASGMARLIVIPVFATLLWLLLWASAPAGFAFWPDGGAGTLSFIASRLSPLVVAALGVIGFERLEQRTARTHGFALSVGVVLAGFFWTSAWGFFVLPDWLEPRYTQLEAGRDLGARLVDRSELHQFHADALFLSNDLRYELANSERFSEQLPEVVVTGIPFDGDDAELEKHYALVTGYALHTSSRFDWPRAYAAQRVCGTPRVYCVGVYERVDSAEGSRRQAR